MTASKTTPAASSTLVFCRNSHLMGVASSPPPSSSSSATPLSSSSSSVNNHDLAITHSIFLILGENEAEILCLTKNEAPSYPYLKLALRLLQGLMLLPLPPPRPPRRRRGPRRRPHRQAQETPIRLPASDRILSPRHPILFSTRHHHLPSHGPTPSPAAAYLTLPQPRASDRIKWVFENFASATVSVLLLLVEWW